MYRINYHQLSCDRHQRGKGLQHDVNPIYVTAASAASSEGLLSIQAGSQPAAPAGTGTGPMTGPMTGPVSG